jgi:hypothetical protein
MALILIVCAISLSTNNRNLTPAANDESVSHVDAVPVFYNLFVGQESDVTRVEDLIAEQFRELLPEHRIFMHSIGVPMNISIKLLEHHAEGSELVTLHSLWEYCTINPEAKVVYLHSKGSFHPNANNNRMRAFLTIGALSRECLTLPTTCNVCSSRMSPIPHPHTPGNMWLARCSYIQHLIDPKLFESRMAVFDYSGNRPSCFGQQRYAAEHWIYSHPSAMPCDLCTDQWFTWSYYPMPSHNFHKQLSPAPRFPLQTYVKARECGQIGQILEQRLNEYRVLYNETPPSTWWGWKLFHDHDKLLKGVG